MASKVLTAIVILMTGTVLAAPAAPQPAAVGLQAQEVLAKIAARKGVCVVLGLPQAGQARFVTDLASGSEFLMTNRSISTAAAFA